MFRTPLSRAFRRPAITAHLRMRWAPVRSIPCVLDITSISVVRVWDTVGEDQVLKGEYKVFAGKMCVPELNQLLSTADLTRLQK